MKVALFSDDPPTARDVPAYGLCRVNAHIVSALERDLVGVITGTKGGLHGRSELLSTTVPTFLWGANTVVSTWLRRLRGRPTADRILFAHALDRIASNVRYLEPDLLLIVVGADPGVIFRGRRLARETRIPYAVLMVDDILEAYRHRDSKPRRARLQLELAAALKEAQVVLAVTEGLCESIGASFETSAHRIDFPFEPYDVPLVEQRLPLSEVLFVGNASHFYHEGLQDLFSALEVLAHHGNDITVRFTTPPHLLPIESRQRRRIAGTHALDEGALARYAGNSICCFAPYSFNRRFESMVRTSFPSKLLEYMGYAHRILVYAPLWASSSKYFAVENLDYVLAERDVSALARTLAYFQANVPSARRQYRARLAEKHGYQVFRDRLLHICAGTT